MRLICGFYHRDGREAEKTKLDVMVNAMIEPGLNPQIAQWVEGSVALAVLDFGRDIPFKIVRTESGLILAADCRLDAPDELRRVLGIDGCADDEILLAALQRWGKDDLAKILGDFAFAAWNPQTDSLLCARDGMGIRPFFMSNKNQDFAFASLPRALHAGGFASRQLDECYLASYLLGTPSGQERSLYSDIAGLKPGHLLHVSARGIRSETYWQLDSRLAGSRRCSPEEAAEELAATLAEAVRCRLPAKGAVASHLSGGLDSSAITILAMRNLRQQGRSLLAYSFLSRTEDAERPYIEAVLRQEEGIDWNPVTIDDHATYAMPRMDCDHLYPFDLADPDNRVCADAARRGAGFLLSGWGGDEGATFNGQGALAEALLKGKWRYLANEIGAVGRVRKCSSLRVVKGELLYYFLPDHLPKGLSRLRNQGPDIRSIVASVVKPEIADMAQERRPWPGPNAVLNRHQLLQGTDLSRLTCQRALMGARYGMAVGFPMLDRRVVELALSLQSPLFIREGWKRRVFRDAMINVIPDEIRWQQDKLAPFPESPEQFRSHRTHFFSRLAELREHPMVSRFLIPENIEKLQHDNLTMFEITALRRILKFAIYLQQHH
ncbi:MAG: asparagine synthase-related protein [Methylobacter sp.]